MLISLIEFFSLARCHASRNNILFHWEQTSRIAALSKSKLCPSVGHVGPVRNFYQKSRQPFAGSFILVYSAHDDWPIYTPAQSLGFISTLIYMFIMPDNDHSIFFLISHFLRIDAR